jgi:hypothetical protein
MGLGKTYSLPARRMGNLHVSRSSPGSQTRSLCNNTPNVWYRHFTPHHTYTAFEVQPQTSKRGSRPHGNG